MRLSGFCVSRSKVSVFPSADFTSVTWSLGCSSMRTVLETSWALNSTLATADRDCVMGSRVAETAEGSAGRAGGGGGRGLGGGDEDAGGANAHEGGDSQLLVG